ncbi:hypothetical protein [Frigoribacterium sp. VKM Ac-2530]|uniref:hypothetical protein n=1 Tax=Frigoribacterium sp. VKM Ac-2530 TaxID=2783822 RepID=UPI00188CA1EC|nr:hypothetical protein [Frigoribacterium sp. VKM Ac-2530]
MTVTQPRPHDVPEAPRQLRMPPLDRLAASWHVLSRLGPLELPTRDALVEALRRVASVGPDARVGLLPGRPGHWTWDATRLDAAVQRMVVVDETGELGRLDASAALSALADRVDRSLPVQFVLSGQHLLAVYDHAVVDARFTAALPGALIDLAAGSAVPEWITAVGARRPLVSALVATFVRHPRRVLDLVASRAASRGVALPAVPHADPPCDVPVTPARPVPVQAATGTAPHRVAVVRAEGTAEAYRALRRRLREVDPAPSFAAAVLVMLRRALLDEGVDLDPLSDVVYDVRQWLDGDDQVPGNFVTALPIGGGLDAFAVERALRATVSSGRPLAALAIGAARETLRPRRVAVSRAAATATASDGPGPSPARPGSVPARISLSSVGVVRSIQRLPWVREGRPAEAAYAVDPVGPGAVSVQLLIVDGVVQVTVALGAGAPSPEVVERAARRVLTEPVLLLDALGVGRADEAR